MSRITTGVTMLVWMGLALLGCSKSSSPVGESESHFLMACSEDNCGDGLTCLCGVCTTACENDSTCGALADGASCADPDAASCGGDTMERSCALTCETAADCRTVHPSLECTMGRCQGSATAPGPDDGPTDGRTCDDVRAAYESELADVRRCQQDSDCGQSLEAIVECNCGPDALARNDADLSELEALRMTSIDGETCLPRGSGCACRVGERFESCTRGMCTWGFEACVGGTIVDDTAACPRGDAFCYPLPDGRLCTGSSTPECPRDSVEIPAGSECPGGYECFASEGTLQCATRTTSEQQCRAEGGTPVPGSGGIDQCPDGQRRLAYLPPLFDGGVCCGEAVTSCAPQLADVVGGCEPAPRYYWNGFDCIGLSGCDCLGPDCDAAFSSRWECLAHYIGCEDVVTPCGGFAGPSCGDGEFCAYGPVNNCLAPDPSAICQPLPDGCDLNLDEVCGCDGQTYDNACTAQSGGQGVLHWGPCEP